MIGQPREEDSSLDFHGIEGSLLGLPVEEAYDGGVRFLRVAGAVFRDDGNLYFCEECGGRAYDAVQERVAVFRKADGSVTRSNFKVNVPYCPNCEEEPMFVSGVVMNPERAVPEVYSLDHVKMV